MRDARVVREYADLTRAHAIDAIVERVVASVSHGRDIRKWWPIEDVLEASPQRAFISEGARSIDYDIPRVRFFLDQLAEGRVLQRVEIVDGCINDGWHRLAAHLYAGRTTVRCLYWGEAPLMNYLIGARKTKPKRV